MITEEEWNTIFGEESMDTEPPAKTLRAAGITNNPKKKLLLQCAQRIRLLMAISVHTLVGKKTITILKQAKAATAKYSATTKGQKGHNHGTPDSWGFIAAILQILPVSGVKSPAHTKKFREFLQEHAKGSAKLCQAVRCWRLERMYDATTWRIVFKLAPEYNEVEDIVLIYLEGAGCTRVHGQAPPGALERVVQESL